MEEEDTATTLMDCASGNQFKQQARWHPRRALSHSELFAEQSLFIHFCLREHVRLNVSSMGSQGKGGCSPSLLLYFLLVGVSSGLYRDVGMMTNNF